MEQYLAVRTMPEPEPYSAIRKLLPYTTVALIVTLLYVGYVFYSRWQERREFEAKRAEAQAEDARKTIAAYGAGELKVFSFYATPGEVRAGQPVELCYGVANAKTLRIEPEDPDVWPSQNHCVEVSPKKDTTYTMTAEDGAGHKDVKTLTVRVR